MSVRFGLDVDVHSFRRERPPVLLLGGLNLIRPLGLARIPVIVGSSDMGTLAFRSRYCTGRCLLPPLGDQAAAGRVLIEAGQRLKSALGRPVPLFYGNDDYLNLIYAFREALEERFLLLLNDQDIALDLLEKDRFQDLARRRGVPVPRVLSWDESADGGLGRAAGPVLAKPNVTTDREGSPLFRELFGGRGKALVFGSGLQAMGDPLVARFRDQLTFQEFVPGGDEQLFSFNGFADHHHELLCWFVGRKLRTSPSLSGESSFLELVHSDTVAELGRNLVARIPLKGVFKIDVKKDARNGGLRVFEVNARFNLWHHLGARNGLNLPAIVYAFLVHGVRPSRAGYRTDFRWVDFAIDRHAFRELHARGDLSAVRWVASLIGGPRVWSVFSWRDPLPWCWRLGWKAMSLARRWLSTAS